jgi:hypothetical protein
VPAAVALLIDVFVQLNSFSVEFDAGLRVLLFLAGLSVEAGYCNFARVASCSVWCARLQINYC